MKAREVLNDVYESDIELEYKRVLKRERLKTLAEDVAAELQSNGKEASGWLTGELNNARLISTTLYEGHLPSFRALYSRCEMQIDCFYTEAKKLADLNYDDRNAALSAGDLLRFGGGANEQ
jgi:predicted aminopeptidase